MSEDRIFLIRDGELQEMSKEKYDEESVLQKQIEDHSSLIPGEQINPDNPRRWLAVEREAGIQDDEDSGNRWSVDHLFLDQDGIPTLIEVKRQQDTRIRRKVVAQMLDYAANTTSYWNKDMIQERLYSKLENEEKVLEEFLEDESTIEEFWEDVETNLDRKKIRLLFVADNIPSELKSIVEFLNEQMSPAQVLAVELGHYEGQGEEALVPRIIGQTEEARQKKQNVFKSEPPRKPWNEENFYKEVESNLDKESHIDAVKKLYRFSKKNGEIKFGKNSKRGAIVVNFPSFSENRSCYTLYGNGDLRIDLDWFESEDKKNFLLDLYSNISSLGVGKEDNRDRIHPSVEDWSSNVDDLIEALERVEDY